MEKEFELKIVFSLEDEIKRLEDTIKRIPWYKANGYFERLKIPQNISEESNKNDIETSIKNEYNEDFYREFVDYIESRFNEIKEKLQILRELKSFSIKNLYTIKLTKYGTGGSYKYEGEKAEIIINIQSKNKEKLLGTIAHEVTHIGIEDLIKKYNIKQWDKERIVDLTLERLFPGFKTPQKTHGDVSRVDNAFNNFFPDMEAVIKDIEEK